MGLLEGKNALVFGVANDHSIAWGIAQALHAEGASVGFSSIESLIDKRVRPLAASIGSTFVEPADVQSDADIERVFARWGETTDHLDILVHASTIGEPCGQVVAEGMAAGKPVIATKGGGVPEIIQENVSGILVQMNNPDQLADALLRLCADPSLRQSLAAAARQRIESHFTIQRTAQGVMAVWDRLLA